MKCVFFSVKSNLAIKPTYNVIDFAFFGFVIKNVSFLSCKFVHFQVEDSCHNVMTMGRSEGREGGQEGN